ncbi:MAG: helix-turn-helix transcriptional regulator [Hydrogenoanaerobacterium sp.]
MPFNRDRLKKRRIDMGITLQEIADAIGVEKPTVQRYESGKINKIDTITVEKLSTAIKCSPAYLMGWQDTPQIQQDNFTMLNVHEKMVISAYRKTPTMRLAVDRILNITTEQEEPIDAHIPDIENIDEEAEQIKRKLSISADSKK